MKRLGLIVCILYLTFQVSCKSRDVDEDVQSFDWSPDYLYDQGEMPYDIDVFIDVLKKEVHTDSFIRLRAPFSTYEPYTNGAFYLSIGQEFERDYHESYALMDFVSQGNIGLIAAESYSPGFLDAMSLDIEFMTCSEEGGLTGQTGLFTDSLELMLHNEMISTKIRSGLRPWGWMPFQVIIQHCLDSAMYEPVLHTPGGNLIGIKLNIGDGELYLLSLPLMFTNYNMIHEENFEFVNALFKSMKFNKVYWDQVGFTSIESPPELTKTTFSELFKNKSLRTAFYILIFGILLFLIFALQRYQPAIELYRPPGNASVSFSKSIARLYWLHPNHKKMAMKKMKFFFSEVRNRYGLETQEDTPEFRQQLTKKSGMEERHINRLLDAYYVVRTNNDVHEKLLFQISESIAYIRQHWK